SSPHAIRATPGQNSRAASRRKTRIKEIIAGFNPSGRRGPCAGPLWQFGGDNKAEVQICAAKPANSSMAAWRKGQADAKAPREDSKRNSASISAARLRITR